MLMSSVIKISRNILAGQRNDLNHKNSKRTLVPFALYYICYVISSVDNIMVKSPDRFFIIKKKFSQIPKQS